MSIGKTLAGAVVAVGMTIGGAAFAAPTTVNLGFAIDHSGSMSDISYTLQKNGLANALALIPRDNPDFQYNISIISFGDDVKTLVAPILLTDSNLSSVQTAITSHSRTNTGSTQTGAAIDRLVSLFSGSIGNTLTLFNISTDGVPCCQGGAQSIAQTASDDAFAAGLNSLSFEAVGGFTPGSINNMLALAGPNAIEIDNAADLPDATKQGFVLKVASFDDYDAAIKAKIQKIVDDTTNPSQVPLPASLPLLLGAIGLMGGLRLRKRSA